MLRELTATDWQEILEYAYRRERENLFIIGNLVRDDAFARCHFLGLEKGGALTGVAAVFLTYGSFVVHAVDPSLVPLFVDAVMERQWTFESIPAFRRHAKPMVDHLRSRYGRAPRRVSEETVFLLDARDFQPVESAAEPASEGDRDACVRLEHGDPARDITDAERSCIVPAETFVLREGEQIVSKANVHGFSRRYAQIGGVATLPAFRRRGYGRQCVSALCAHCFGKGVEAILLFTTNTNLPAQNLYRSLGFKPVDDFLIAEYG